jgi:hypothetical protein
MPVLIIVVLLLTGCINISTQTQPSNPAVKPLLQGSDCVPIFFGLGAGDATIEKALLNGRAPKTDVYDKKTPAAVPIRSVHRVQTNDMAILFFGERCVEVQGEP